MLLTRLDCHNDDHVGEISVNEANILQFLGVIEQQTNEILHVYNRRIVCDEMAASTNFIKDKDDHVEIGDLVGINVTDSSSTPIFTIRISNDRVIKLQGSMWS